MTNLVGCGDAHVRNSVSVCFHVCLSLKLQSGHGSIEHASMGSLQYNIGPGA